MNCANKASAKDELHLLDPVLHKYLNYAELKKKKSLGLFQFNMRASKKGDTSTTERLTQQTVIMSP